MGSVLMKRVQAGLAYAPLAATGGQSGAFLLMADPRNVGNLTLKDSLGNECEWVPGQAVLFGDANLSEIQFLGAVTDYLYVFGGNPRAGSFDADTSALAAAAGVAGGAAPANRIYAAGYNVVEGAQGVYDPMALNNTPKQATLLNAVTADGAGSPQSTLDYLHHTIYIIASSVTTGASVLIESSGNASNYGVLETVSVAANGVIIKRYEGKLYDIRASIASRTDGTYTVLLVSGR